MAGIDRDHDAVAPPAGRLGDEFADRFRRIGRATLRGQRRREAAGRRGGGRGRRWRRPAHEARRVDDVDDEPVAVLGTRREENFPHDDRVLEVEHDPQPAGRSRRVAQAGDAAIDRGRELQRFAAGGLRQVDDHPVRVSDGEDLEFGRRAEIEDEACLVRRMPHAQLGDLDRPGPRTDHQEQ